MQLSQNTCLRMGNIVGRTNGPRHNGHSLLTSGVSSSPVISCTSVVFSHIFGDSPDAESR